jgi:hypothetical protein
MTKEEQYNLNLQNLHCCISTKFEHYSRLIQLGSPLKKCKLEELQLLNILYDILSCHLPLSCVDNYTSDFVFTQEDLDNISEWDLGIDLVFKLNDGEFIDIQDGNGDALARLQAIVDYINANSETLGYTAILEDNTIKISDGIGDLTITLYNEDGDIPSNYIIKTKTLRSSDLCCNLETIPAVSTFTLVEDEYIENITPQTYRCIPDCLTELQIRNLWKYVGKLCKCNYKYEI